MTVTANQIPDLITNNYSGIISSNNFSDQNVSITSGSTIVSQEFYLPSDYKRFSHIPDLTGFQVFIKVKGSNADTISATYNLELNSSSLVTGTQTGCAADAYGNSWFSIKFKSISLTDTQLTGKFKFTLTFADSTKIDKIYYTSPTDTKVAGLVNGIPGLITHRIFAAVADSGKDFLNNDYRSVVVKQPISTINTSNQISNYWMSKPNPSEFGVENLYFNLGVQKVIDSVYLDPTTPNVYFNVYYSNDTDPGYDNDTWDDLLWTHIPMSFKATKAQNYIFPEPISAKFIKIEFSHLQAQPYSVGTFQKPIMYKKHPKWVLDYFLTAYSARRNQTHDVIIAGNVDVTYNALDLAYNYYKDDIFTSANGAETIGLTNYSDATNILTSVSDTENLGSETISKIKIVFQQFVSNSAIYADSSTIIGKIAKRRASSNTDSFSVEDTTTDLANTGEVSVLNREPLILEKNFPVMFFYVTSRHKYRKSLAKFENDKAYFVGVNQIAFQRIMNHVAEDTSLYIENTGDSENVLLNDFNYGTSGWSVQ